MNRNLTGGGELNTGKLSHHQVGEQPRKLMTHKVKKEKFFERLDNEPNEIEMEKHRQNYKRAANKYSTRIQLHSTESVF